MRRALPLLLALSVGASGCRKKAEYPPPERYLPATAPLAVVIPALGAAARQVGALYRTVAQAPPAAQLAEAYGAVRSQLGFDPLDPRGLEQAGVDPNGSAGFATGETPLLVLPILDLARFDSTAARLARDRMGAAERIAFKVKGLEVVAFRKDSASGAALAYVAVGPHALLSPGPRGPDAVASAALLPEERSLAKSPLFGPARAAVGEGYLATALAPPGSPLLSGATAARDGAALGVRASATALGLRLALLLPPDRERWWRAVESPEGGRAPAEASRLAPDAVLLLRWAGDPSAGYRRAAPLLPADFARSLAAARLDPEKELVAALAPGAALSLSLAKGFTFTEFSSPRFDVRRRNPFGLLELEAVLPLRDASALRPFLERLQKAGPRLGVKVTPRGPSDWTVAWGMAQLGLHLAGDRLLVAGPAARLADLSGRERGGGGYQATTEAAGAALATGLGGAVVDVDHLVHAIEGLPEAAYGSGPNAVVMRSLVDRYLEPASALATVSLRLDLAPGAALLDLEVVGRSAPPKP